MCWDLERNEVVRSYFGHRNGVYSCALHPQLDVVLSAGRDGLVRVWDVRTRGQVLGMGGHKAEIHCVVAQADEPQVVTGSADSTIRFWDLRMSGRCVAALTNHRRGVRCLAVHPVEYGMASGAADRIKKWGFPHGDFVSNFGAASGAAARGRGRGRGRGRPAAPAPAGDQQRKRAIVHTLALNPAADLLVAGDDTGMLDFYHWTSGRLVQSVKSLPQPGSLDCEAAVYCTAFDKTSTRLLTGEGDKSIKVYARVEGAAE